MHAVVCTQLSLLCECGAWLLAAHEDARVHTAARTRHGKLLTALTDCHLCPPELEPAVIPPLREDAEGVHLSGCLILRTQLAALYVQLELQQSTM